VGSGLIKKATIAGIEGNETEGALAKALGSRAVQLAGLKILSVPFSKRHAEPAWSKSTALFWGQDLYRELSQLPLRQLTTQKGGNPI
jgi:hypothetical protein